MAVLAGWYATVAVALALWISDLPATSPVDDECYGFGCDWSPRDIAVVALLFLTPVLLVGGGVALATLSLTGRRLTSAVVTGTLAAAVGLVGTPAVLVLGWMALS